jgi:hypothetical protein
VNTKIARLANLSKYLLEKETLGFETYAVYWLQPMEKQGKPLEKTVHQSV